MTDEFSQEWKCLTCVVSKHTASLYGFDGDWINFCKLVCRRGDCSCLPAEPALALLLGSLL
jgi:hypothetical protein